MGGVRGPNRREQLRPRCTDVGEGGAQLVLGGANVGTRLQHLRRSSGREIVQQTDLLSRTVWEQRVRYGRTDDEYQRVAIFQTGTVAIQAMDPFQLATRAKAAIEPLIA